MSSLGFVQVSMPDGRTEVVRFDVLVAATAKVSPFNFMQDAKHAALRLSGMSTALESIVVHEPVNTIALSNTLATMRYNIQILMNVFGISEQHLLQLCGNSYGPTYREVVYGHENVKKKTEGD